MYIESDVYTFKNVFRYCYNYITRSLYDRTLNLILLFLLSFFFYAYDDMMTHKGQGAQEPGTVQYNSSALF